jgi:DNA-binding NtrC family response regulator
MDGALAFKAPPQRRVALVIYHARGSDVVRMAPNRAVIIGRGPPSTLLVRDRALSRAHARFDLLESEVWAQDLGSRNGTWVNGRRAEPACPLQVKPGDSLRLGSSTSVSIDISGELDAELGPLTTHDLFMTVLGLDLIRAKAFGRQVGMIMVRSATEGASFSSWCQRVAHRLRPVDQIAVYGPNIAEIAVAETNDRSLLSLANTIAQKEADDAPRLLCGVALYPRDARSANELQDMSRTAMERADLDHPVISASESRSANIISAGAITVGGAQPVAASVAMRALFSTIARIAGSSIPVLLEGETGTGKEVVARAIHDRGPRRNKPLQNINCAALPANLIESLLFGHERGAFTSASERTKGMFEAANGGTVFLDEIGELSPAAQASLLRVLETKTVRRVGATDEVPVDVRIIAATHRDLQKMCEQGMFRADLMYRLNAMVLRIPPLRERIDDIEPLVRDILADIAASNGEAAKEVTAEAIAALRKHDWPGNVRELRNVIERAVVIRQNELIGLDDLPDGLRATRPPSLRAEQRFGTVSRNDSMLGRESPTRDGPEPSPTPTLVERTESFVLALILEALIETRWNKSEAAKRIGMPRRTLTHKIKQHGLQKGPTAAVLARLSETERSAARAELAHARSVEFQSCVDRYRSRILSATLRGENQSTA